MCQSAQLAHQVLQSQIQPNKRPMRSSHQFRLSRLFLLQLLPFHASPCYNTL